MFKAYSSHNFSVECTVQHNCYEHTFQHFKLSKKIQQQDKMSTEPMPNYKIINLLMYVKIKLCDYLHGDPRAQNQMCFFGDLKPTNLLSSGIPSPI